MNIHDKCFALKTIDGQKF